MTSRNSVFSIKIIAACALFAGATTLVSAQPVYRIVGADGKVTFSDKPPAEPKAKITSAAGASGGVIASSSLPFELRQVAQKYPVTLYTGENCGPCQSARSMLITRGVPFSEKTVLTLEDSQALQRLSNENSLCHHWWPAAQRLFRCGVDAIFKCGRLPSRIGIAINLPPATRNAFGNCGRCTTHGRCTCSRGCTITPTSASSGQSVRYSFLKVVFRTSAF